MTLCILEVERLQSQYHHAKHTPLHSTKSDQIWRNTHRINQVSLEILDLSEMEYNLVRFLKKFFKLV